MAKDFVAADRLQALIEGYYIQLAALIRVFGGVLPEVYLVTVIISGICWSSAFATYAVRYWPVLSRACLDGKPC